MKRFAQFILENIGSKTKKHDDIVTEMNLDDVYRVDEPQGNEEHPIVTAIKRLASEDIKGDADLVFKIKHGDTTHTVTIPPVEGDHARGRIDFVHEITNNDTRIKKEMHELKGHSTISEAVPKKGPFRKVIDDNLPQPSQTGALRRYYDKNSARIIFSSLIDKMKIGMPVEDPEKEKRFLTISTQKDHGFIHPHQEIHDQIMKHIRTLPKKKQKLVIQSLRLMYEKIHPHATPQEIIKSEFHSTDLDNKEQLQNTTETLTGATDGMAHLAGNRYISVKTGNKNEHAIVRVDPEDFDELDVHLSENLPLEDSHPLHGKYVGRIVPKGIRGRKATTIEASHKDAVSTMSIYSTGREMVQYKTRNKFRKN